MADTKRPAIPIPKGGHKTNEEGARWLADTLAMRLREGLEGIGIHHVHPHGDQFYDLLLVSLDAATRRALRDHPPAKIARAVSP